MKKAMDMPFQEAKIKLIQKGETEKVLVQTPYGVEWWRHWNVFRNMKVGEEMVVVKVIRKKALESPTIYSKDFAIVEKRSDGEYDKYVLYLEFKKEISRRRRK